MAYHDDLCLGLIWITGEQSCYVFDAERPAGECMTRPKNLLSDHRYLTNLSYDAHGKFLDDHREYHGLGGLLCMDTTLIVGLNTLAEEIGMPRFEKTQDPEHFVEILATLYHTYRHVCLRTGIDPLGIEFTPKGVRETIFHRTTNGAVRAVTDDEVKEGLSVTPHRWVNTGTVLPDGAYRRRLTISRQALYYPLLSALTPIGDWSEGEPSASLASILSARSPEHDVLIRGRLNDLPRTGFPDAITTENARRYYTGEEVALIADSDRELEVLNWWHGEVGSAPALPEFNTLSLVDDVILEIMHRSWRENRGTGFWQSVAERLRLQRLARSMHLAGIPVLGYGSGKIVIATPEDREDKTARHEQDTLLLTKFGEFGIQPPLEHLLDHPDLASLVPHLTDLQALSLAGPTFLRRIDEAITLGDADRYNEAINEADAALSDVVSQLAVASPTQPSADEDKSADKVDAEEASATDPIAEEAAIGEENK